MTSSDGGYRFPWGVMSKLVELIKKERKEGGDEKVDKVLMHDPVTGMTKYVAEGESMNLTPREVMAGGTDNPPFATAEVNVSQKLYGQWMASVRDRLPKNIRWGYDINAVVSVSGPEFCRVKWTARTPAGIAYLNSLGNTLMNPELPPPDPALSAPGDDPDCADCSHGKNCHIFEPQYPVQGFCGKGLCVCKSFKAKQKLIVSPVVEAEIVEDTNA